MKKYTIRFHKAHDLDIISIFEDREFDIVKAMYCALTAFSKGEVFAIKVPPKRDQSYHIKRRVYCRHLRLNETKDAKAIALLNKISKGYRNNFLKNLLRLYLGMPIASQFLEDPNDMDLFMSMFDIFRKDRRMVSAADMKNICKNNSKSGNGTPYPDKISKKVENNMKNSKNPLNKGVEGVFEEGSKRNENEAEPPKAEMISAFGDKIDLSNVSPDVNDDAELTDIFSEMLKN